MPSSSLACSHSRTQIGRRRTGRRPHSGGCAHSHSRVCHSGSSQLLVLTKRRRTHERTKTILAYRAVLAPARHPHRQPNMPPSSSPSSSSLPPSPLLNLFAPNAAASTSRLALTSSSATGPTYVHLKSTPLQSSRPVVRELVASTCERGENVVVITGDAAAVKRADGVTVIPAYDHSCRREFDDDAAGPTWTRDALAAIQSASSTRRPTTLIVESLDCLLDDNVTATDTDKEAEADGARAVYRSLLPLVSALDARSRFVFGTTIASHSLRSREQARIVTLLSSRASSSSSSFMTVQLHPPATWRYLLAEYGSGLRPASTTSRVAKQLRHKEGSAGIAAAAATRQQRIARTVGSRRNNADDDDDHDDDSADSAATLLDWDAPPWRETDPRLWSILASATSRSALTQGHWWADEEDRLKGEEIEAVRATPTTTTTFDPMAHRITLADLLGPVSSSGSNHAASRRNEDERTVSTRPRTGWGLLTCEYRLSGGSSAKYGQDVMGVVCVGAAPPSPSPRLHLVPLEMGDYRSSGGSNTNAKEQKQSSAAAAAAPRPLPFNLSLTSEQRARRDQVDLPFAPTERIYEGISTEAPEQLRRGSTGQSTIYFEPDSADEEDEEDPDDDLDI